MGISVIDMGFFSKRNVDGMISEKNEEREQKEELKTEAENIQNDPSEKQELDIITNKIHTVKEEYNTIVSNLMLVKKELNYKNLELDAVHLEYKKIRDKIKNFEKIKDSESINEFNKTEKNLLKMKQELNKITEKYDNIKKQVEQEQSTLHNIINQQTEYQKELDEARSRLYNAKEELDRKDNFQDMSVLTPKEREFIQGEGSKQKGSAGIIEAASVVVSSLKSKLNMTQKELEAVQLLLEKERKEHEKIKQKLEKFKASTK